LLPTLSKSSEISPADPSLDGVGWPTVSNPVQPLPDVGRPDAVCAHNRSPEGVTRSLHVCPYSIEPYRDRRIFSAAPNLSDNGGAGDLLAEHDGGSASSNKVCEYRPKVAFVVCPFPDPGATERLTRTRACPDSGDVFKSCPPQGKRPETDTGEEVTLIESIEFICVYLRYAPPVHHARLQMAGVDQFPQPRAGFGVVVVVVVHFRPPSTAINRAPQSAQTHSRLPRHGIPAPHLGQTTTAAQRTGTRGAAGETERRALPPLPPPALRALARAARRAATRLSISAWRTLARAALRSATARRCVSRISAYRAG
jgi:hypothetical protein